MTGLQLRMSDPVQENWCTQTSYTDKPYICFEAVYFKGHFASHDIPILVKSPIKEATPRYFYGCGFGRKATKQPNMKPYM